MKRITRQMEMESLLRAYRTSGVSRQSFCATQGIKESTLYYWQRKLWDEDKEASSLVSGFEQLIPRQDHEIKLQLAGGQWLALRSECMETLAELVLTIGKIHA